MRTTVTRAVKEELLQDCQSQHFTHRMQRRTLAKAKKPLTRKIEAKVEEKLAELKREIEQLRAAKVVSPTHKHGGGGDDGGDGGDTEESAAGDVDFTASLLESIIGGASHQDKESW